MTKTPSEISDVLGEFGLSTVEASVYQAALALGSRPASAIAQKAGLKRGHGYNVLQSLMDKGLVQEFVKNGVKHFTCSPPSSLFTIVRNREDELKRAKARIIEIIPDLEKIRSPLSSQPKVRLYPGLEGVKEIYEDMLRVPNTEIRAMIDIETSWSSVLSQGAEFAAQFVERRHEQNIYWYGIVAEIPALDEILSRRPSNLRKCKIAQGLQFPAEISIYGSKVAYISARDEFVGVVVDNEAIAISMRNLFHFLWDTLPTPVIEG